MVVDLWNKGQNVRLKKLLNKISIDKLEKCQKKIKNVRETNENIEKDR